MRRILVGLDGTAEARRAAHFAANMAHAERKELVLACVTPGPVDAGPFAAEYSVWQSEQSHRREEELGAIAQIEAREDVPVTVRLLDGVDPAETLARAANEDEDVELVVVGHRQRGAMARTLMGSVADRLVQICDKPVLVVH